MFSAVITQACFVYPEFFHSGIISWMNPFPIPHSTDSDRPVTDRTLPPWPQIKKSWLGNIRLYLRIWFLIGATLKTKETEPKRSDGLSLEDGARITKTELLWTALIPFLHESWFYSSFNFCEGHSIHPINLFLSCYSQSYF